MESVETTVVMPSSAISMCSHGIGGDDGGDTESRGHERGERRLARPRGAAE